MNWAKIKIDNQFFFKSNPIEEIVLADLFEKRYLRRPFNSILGILSFTVRLIIRLIRNIFILKSNQNYDVVITAYLDKANDWGIKYPVAKYFDLANKKVLFILSNVCIKNHKEELDALNNTVCISSKKFNLYKINFNYIKLCISSINKSASIIRSYKLGSIVEYFLTYLSYAFWAEGVYNKWLKKTKISVTLGERRFGILYQLYNTKHFLLQHGHNTSLSIQTWPNYTSANNYYSIVFGEAYKKKIELAYPQTKIISLGNPYYDYIVNKNYKDKENIIVFFSGYENILGERKKLDNKEWIAYETMDEIIKLFQNTTNYKFIVKLHPHDKADAFIKYNPIFGREIEIIDGKTDSFEILSKAKIAIAWASTTMLEAVISNTLSVQLQKDKNIERQEYCVIVNNLNEIQGLMHDELMIQEKCKEQRRIVVKKYLSNLGNATESIGKFLIHEM